MEHLATYSGSRKRNELLTKRCPPFQQSASAFLNQSNAIAARPTRETVEAAGHRSIGPFKGNYLILLAMVRPEARAVEGQRTGGERNTGEIINLRRIGAAVHAREPVVVRLLRVRRNEICEVANRNLPADAMGDGDDPLHISFFAQHEHFPGIPLAYAQTLTIPTKL